MTKYTPTGQFCGRFHRLYVLCSYLETYVQIKWPNEAVTNGQYVDSNVECKGGWLAKLDAAKVGRTRQLGRAVSILYMSAVYRFSASRLAKRKSLTQLFHLTL